ncbi:hypothetical protein L7F22_041673 [Adiantum nelumboides]|nr:hypothetical protein [Adiantum nelumboides]
MGCSASKRQLGREEKNAPLTRSFSLPGSSAKAEGGSPSKPSWRSSSRAVGSVDGHYVGTEHMRSSSKLKPVTEEDVLPAEKTSYKGLDCKDSPSPRKNVLRKHTPTHRSASFGHVHEMKPEATFSPSKGVGNDTDGQKMKLAEGKPLHTDSRGSSFRVVESIDGFTGLRLLLSPATTPSRSFASSARSGLFALNQSTESPSSLNSKVTQIAKVLPPHLEGMGDSEEIGSPLFDPSILATFEKAIEASSDDAWQGSDATSSSCSRVGSSSLDTCSDAESFDCHREYGVCEGVQSSSARWMCTEDRACKAESDYISNATARKKPSSKVTPFLNDAWVKKDYLEGFDVNCPPGCEDKIVLYFTSLRGIRKTYEDCCTVRLILKGFGVQVDERDVWMHSSFRQELTKLVGSVLLVPRLFMKGRYIGGVEDVKHLHEEGILGHLLEGLPVESNSMCGMCGGIRFIPCISCSGSCKLISSRDVSRCPDCNENGLMMCPSCHQ